MKVRARWPLRLIGIAIFGTVAAVPWSIMPSPKAVVPPQASVDPEIERRQAATRVSPRLAQTPPRPIVTLSPSP